MSFASFIKVTANHPKRSLHISAFTFQLARISRRGCDAGMSQRKCVTAAFPLTLGHDNGKNEAKPNLSKNMTNMVNSVTLWTLLLGMRFEMLQARRSRILTAERLIDCEIASINRRQAATFTFRLSAISSTSSSTRQGMPLSGWT